MLWLIVGVSGGAVGFAIAWFVAKSSSNANLLEYKIESQGNLRASETSNSELRAKISELKTGLEGKTAEVNRLQGDLKAESERKASALGELEHLRPEFGQLSVVRDQFKIESELRAVAETKLSESQQNLNQQRQLLDEARQKLSDAFAALSADALKSNNKAFLDLAKGEFATIQAQAKGDLETRRTAIDGLVQPLKDSLERYESQILQMEQARQKAYGGLDEQLATMAAANEHLRRETGNLVTALRSPQVRGRWGEMTLKRAAELAGMSEYCDFTLQETLTNEDVRQRPDMLVNLPGDRRIVVDAKVPLEAFLRALAANNDAERSAEFGRHGQLVRNHMNQLASRGYLEQFSQAPEVVVLFLPGEAFFSAAVEQDRSLIEDGIEKKVFLVTPTTLIALLRTVAHLWRQQEIEKNSQEISELGKQLHDRIATFTNHLQDMSTSLRRTVEAFNRAAGSFENRVLTGARKFKELRATVGEHIIEITPVDEIPRSFEASEPNDGEQK